MGMSFATRAPPLAEFGARAARLNNRNPEPEGCNFLRDGFKNGSMSPRGTEGKFALLEKYITVLQTLEDISHDGHRVCSVPSAPDRYR
jgi:hypothetical protein